MEEQVTDLAKAIEFAEKQVGLAEAVQRLQSNPDWQLVIEKRYFDDWAKTQVRNIGSYNMEQRKGYLEQAIARGILDDFIWHILEDGKAAKEALPSLKEEMSNG